MYQPFIKVFIMALLIGGLGYLARVTRILSHKSTLSLTKFVISFTLPCLAFFAIIKNLDPEFLGSVFYLPVYAIYTMIVGLLSGSLFLPFLETTPPKSRTFLHMIVVNNFMLLPVPFAAIMYGGPGLAVLFMLMLGLVFGYWTIGVWILKNDINMKEQIMLLLNPLFITILLSLILSLSYVSRFIPKILIETAGIAGEASIPLILFLTGASMHKTDLKRDFSIHVLLVMVRLICFPAFVIMSITMLYHSFGLPEIVYNILLICALMPVALTTPSLCRRLNSGEDTFAETAVFYTTMASIVTVPVLFLIFAK